LACVGSHRRRQLLRAFAVDWRRRYQVGPIRRRSGERPDNMACPSLEVEL
jgi:hypothetical protein